MTTDDKKNPLDEEFEDVNETKVGYGLPTPELYRSPSSTNNMFSGQLSTLPFLDALSPIEYNEQEKHVSIKRLAGFESGLTIKHNPQYLSSIGLHNAERKSIDPASFASTEQIQETQPEQAIHLANCLYHYHAENKKLIIIHPPVDQHSPEQEKSIQQVEETIIKYLDLAAETLSVSNLIPTITHGRLKKLTRGKAGSDHIQLQVETHEASSSGLKNKQTKLIDPRDVAQGTFDDTNCGRYVLAMTVIAAERLREGKEITPAVLKQSALVQRIASAQSVTSLRQALSKHLEPASQTTPADKIRAELEDLREIYQIRVQKGQRYLSPFGRIFGHSAEDKLAAINAILSDAPPWDHLPKAAKSGLLEKLTTAYKKALDDERMGEPIKTYSSTSSKR